jgi:RNA polymerase-binding protein DksA
LIPVKPRANCRVTLRQTSWILPFAEKASKQCREIRMNGLTRTQSSSLEKLLQAHRKAALEEAEAELKLMREQSVGGVAGEAPDAGDESVAMLLTDIDHTMAQRHVNEIRAIDRALDQIRDCHFGMCSDCDGEIAYARLTAFPTATRCIACQTMHERTFAHENRATL